MLEPITFGELAIGEMFAIYVDSRVHWTKVSIDQGCTDPFVRVPLDFSPDDTVYIDPFVRALQELQS
jgi:hypothetical protein